MWYWHIASWIRVQTPVKKRRKWEEHVMHGKFQEQRGNFQFACFWKLADDIEDLGGEVDSSKDQHTCILLAVYGSWLIFCFCIEWRFWIWCITCMSQRACHSFPEIFGQESTSHLIRLVLSLVIWHTSWLKSKHHIREIKPCSDSTAQIQPSLWQPFWCHLSCMDDGMVCLWWQCPLTSNICYTYALKELPKG